MARILLVAGIAAATFVAAITAASSQTATPAPAPAAATTPPPTPVPFEQAVLKAAGDTIASAGLDPNKPYELVIDPLVDGKTGSQVKATAIMEEKILLVFLPSGRRT